MRAMQRQREEPMEPMEASRATRRGRRATVTETGSGEVASTPPRRALAYREAFMEAVTPEDVRAIGAALLERARAGDPAAAKLVLDRVLGPRPVEEWKDAEELEMEERQQAFFKSLDFAG